MPPLHRLPIFAFPLAIALGSGCDPNTTLDNPSNADWALQASGITSALVTVGKGQPAGANCDDIYADADGTEPSAPVLKYDGTAWAAALPSMSSCLSWKTPGTVKLSDDLAFTVGPGGTVDRWDKVKMAWNREKTALTEDIQALWAADPTHIFAVGLLGGIEIFDGKTWKVMQSPTQRPLRSVFGASAIDVVAVGDMGTVVHFDGIEWTADESGSLKNLRDVWGSSLYGFFAVGEQGTILQRKMK